MKYYKLSVIKTACSEIFVKVPDDFDIRHIESIATKHFYQACEELDNYDWVYPEYEIDCYEKNDGISELTAEEAKLVVPYVIGEKDEG